MSDQSSNSTPPALFSESSGGTAIEERLLEESLRRASTVPESDSGSDIPFAAAETVAAEALPTHSGPTERNEAGEDFDFAHQRYEQVDILGKGGMGIVFRVRDRLLRRTVAMKTLHRRHQKRSGFGERFLREAQIGSQLQHPNIPPVYDTGILEDGTLYFTAPVLEGVTLEHIINRVHTADSRNADSRWNIMRLLAVFQRCCRAIAFAHGRGVIHRDIKPANIMVGELGETLVVDWGLAKSIEEEDPDWEDEGRVDSTEMHTVAGGLCGTPGYIAPNIIWTPRAPRPGRPMCMRSESYSRRFSQDVGPIQRETKSQHPACGGRKRSPPSRAFPIPEFNRRAIWRETIRRERFGGRVELPPIFVDLCNAALHPIPEDRCTVRELADRVERWLDGTEKRLKAMEKVGEATELKDRIQKTRDQIDTVRRRPRFSRTPRGFSPTKPRSNRSGSAWIESIDSKSESTVSRFSKSNSCEPRFTPR